MSNNELLKCVLLANAMTGFKSAEVNTSKGGEVVEKQTMSQFWENFNGKTVFPVTAAHCWWDSLKFKIIIIGKRFKSFFFLI